jgi:mannose-6-phosphate isomerase-like protein (cupin superfamily)
MEQQQDNFSNHSEKPAVLCLSSEEITSLRVKHNSIQLHVVEGRAWVTYDDNDVIVESGETVNIPSSKYRIIISSANKYKNIRYQIA